MRSDEFRIRADIDLDAILYNMNSMKESVCENTKLVAVIKSDAYGHGAIKIAETIEDLDYVWGFAVAALGEALELIRAGLKKPVLILGSVYSGYFDEIVKNDIRTVIYTVREAEKLSAEALRQGKKARVHLACDVGMGRIGFKCDKEGQKTALEISGLSGLDIEGIFTHFPEADSRDKSRTEAQLKLFKDFTGDLEKAGLHIPLKHCANSACILDYRDSDLSLSRAGISLYGLFPSDEVGPGKDIKPVLALKSHIVYIKEAVPKDRISYGGTFTVDHPMKIATIPAGYGDGYPRGLSNRGYVLIRGKRARILGRVCMDQFMADVTDIPGVEEGDEVTLIGRDGTEEITMETLAGFFDGGFNYEIPCQFTKRVPRIYLKNGERTGELDYYAF